MCEYCKDKKQIVHKYNKRNEDRFKICGNILQIESSRCLGDRSSESFTELKLDYCPFCGDKL